MPLPDANEGMTMVGFTTLTPAKSLHELSPGARALLMDISQTNRVLPRLTGAPLELIGRQLANYVSQMNGYSLAITARGAAMLRPAPRGGAS